MIEKHAVGSERFSDNTVNNIWLRVGGLMPPRTAIGSYPGVFNLDPELGEIGIKHDQSRLRLVAPAKSHVEVGQSCVTLGRTKTPSIESPILNIEDLVFREYRTHIRGKKEVAKRPIRMTTVVWEMGSVTDNEGMTHRAGLRFRLLSVPLGEGTRRNSIQMEYLFPSEGGFAETIIPFIRSVPPVSGSAESDILQTCLETVVPVTA